MKSPWKVSSNYINGEKMYIVYRLRDVNAVDHSGNREYMGGYVISREKCEKLAKELNQKEES